MSVSDAEMRDFVASRCCRNCVDLEFRHVYDPICSNSKTHILHKIYFPTVCYFSIMSVSNQEGLSLASLDYFFFPSTKCRNRPLVTYKGLLILLPRWWQYTTARCLCRSRPPGWFFLILNTLKYKQRQTFLGRMDTVILRSSFNDTK